MQRKAFVLLSGGLDSTTALYMAHREFGGNIEAVSVDYGQRHKKEMEYAKRSCDKLGVRHTILALGGLLSGKGVMLTDANVDVPNISYSDIQGVSPTYVPFRNGVMLSAIAALAQKYVMEQIDEAVQTDPGEGPTLMLDEMALKQYHTAKAKDLVAIYAGMHAEDALNWAYPDCTFEFLGSMANSIYTGTYNTVRLVTPFVFASKAQIVHDGWRNSVPYEDTWSCYKGEEKHCGTCPTCRSRKDAFLAAGISDPTDYAA